MFYHDKKTPYKVRVNKPNPHFTRALQQGLGDIEGENWMMMQYLYPGMKDML